MRAKGYRMAEYDDPTISNVPIELNVNFEVNDFVDLGLDEIAYVKKVDQDGRNFFGIFAADGEQIGIAPEFDLAWAAAIQNDLYPVNVH